MSHCINLTVSSSFLDRQGCKLNHVSKTKILQAKGRAEGVLGRGEKVLHSPSVYCSFTELVLIPSLGE